MTKSEDICALCGWDKSPDGPHNGMCACCYLPDGGTTEELEAYYGREDY